MVGLTHTERNNMLFMDDAQADVYAWQEAVGHPHALYPRNIALEEAELQAQLLIEEGVTEYLDAVKRGDLVDIADALGDALWIVLRGFVAHGMHSDAVFTIIADSNFTKFDENEDPVPHPTIPGKIGKSDRFIPPTEALKVYIRRTLAVEAHVNKATAGNPKNGDKK